MREMNPIWIAIIYGLTSIVTLFVTLGTDKFFIFSDFYVWATILGPTLVIPALMIFWRIKYNQWHWGYLVCGSLLVVGVSFIHLWFIATASATI